jgi:hypothetical protein
MNGYELARTWFDFAFDNRECKVQHTALFMWIIELNNRLGWKSEFGLPMQATMEGLSIGNKSTYSNTLRDLEKWGFIKVVQEARNQYQACVIKLCRYENEPALSTALDTTLIRHSIQQSTDIDPGTEYSSVPIDKPRNKETKKQEDVEKENSTATDFEVPDFVKSNRNDLAEDLKTDPPQFREPPPTWEEVENILSNASEMKNTVCKNENLGETEYLKAVVRFVGDQKAKNKPVKSEGDVRAHFLYWVPKWILIQQKAKKDAESTAPQKGKITKGREITDAATEEIIKRLNKGLYDDSAD